MTSISVLYREPKLLKGDLEELGKGGMIHISVLYREPKLLKECTFDLAGCEAVQFQCSTVSRNC